MDEKRLRGLMGLCVRAGQGVFGEDGVDGGELHLLQLLFFGECGIDLLLDVGKCFLLLSLALLVLFYLLIGSLTDGFNSVGFLDKCLLA